MRLLSILLLVLFCSTPINAQDIESKYDQQDTFEEAAINLTDRYDNELAFTADQRILFQKKVEAFLIRSQEVRDAYSGKKELDELYLLQQEEIAEMSDILTQIQWRSYVEIRSHIQPLAKLKP